MQKHNCKGSTSLIILYVVLHNLSRSPEIPLVSFLVLARYAQDFFLEM